MNDPSSKDPARQLELVRDLLADNATIDGDVLKIGTDSWALHGNIPVLRHCVGGGAATMGKSLRRASSSSLARGGYLQSGAGHC